MKEANIYNELVRFYNRSTRKLQSLVIDLSFEKTLPGKLINDLKCKSVKKILKKPF